MGKIHKALEKSKKEQKQALQNPYGLLKSRLENRPFSHDSNDNEGDRLESRLNSNPKLESIHALLNDASNRETVRGDLDTLDSTATDHDNVSPTQQDRLPRSGGVISQKREIESGVTENKKNETSTLPNEKYTGLGVETVLTSKTPVPQDVVTQKVFSLKGSQDINSPINYFQDSGHPSRIEEGDTVQSLPNTERPLRLHYSLVTLSKPKSFEAEQFKILRANLLFPKSGKAPKTILLTSAVPGEGKTFTAMNLALSLAQNLNSYVLLVDADIRKPEIHKRFGLGDNVKGLSDFLTHNTPIPSLLVKTPLPNLTILPGGQATINPSELVSSERMKILLDELSKRYNDRFVIIDAPPPKLAAETYALARYVEHIIPVVRSGRSNRELVDEMMNLLGRDKINGVVLNCYDKRKTKRFGYHKYSEYYSK